MAKRLRRQCTNGNVAAFPGGLGSCLDAAALVQLTACLCQTPVATLNELCCELAAPGGPAMSRPALGCAVRGGWIGGEKKEHLGRRMRYRVRQKFA